MKVVALRKQLTGGLSDCCNSNGLKRYASHDELYDPSEKPSKITIGPEATDIASSGVPVGIHLIHHAEKRLGYCDG